MGRLQRALCTVVGASAPLGCGGGSAAEPPVWAVAPVASAAPTPAPERARLDAIPLAIPASVASAEPVDAGEKMYGDVLEYLADHPELRSNTPSWTREFDGGAVIGFMPGCGDQGASCDHYSTKVPTWCLPRLKAGRDPEIHVRVTCMEARGVDKKAVRMELDTWYGVPECLLEGYRVHPLPRGFLVASAKVWEYGCVDQAKALAAQVPDGITRECLLAAIEELQLPTAGKPASFVVRIDFEAIAPKPRTSQTPSGSRK